MPPAVPPSPNTPPAKRAGRRSRAAAARAENLFDALEEIHTERKIDKNLLVGALEEAIAAAFRRHHSIGGQVRAKLESNGNFKIEIEKTVVEKIADPLTEIAQKDKIAAGRALGDSLFVEGEKALLRDFGRIAAQTAKMVVRERLREAERGVVFSHYRNREGVLVSGKVQRARTGHFIVEIDGAEAILPRREVPMKENYHEGDRVKAVIVAVRMGPKGTQIVLSRSSPLFLQRLLEQEISEVQDGTVEIKAISREPGVRAKVAVISHDNVVDPVGACVGQRGIRVQTIVRELGGERIDIVRWNAELATFIRNALSPAEVERVEIDAEHRVAKVLVSDQSLSQAIGKEGLNARLAARLTGWRIDIQSRDAEAREKATELWKDAFSADPTEVPDSGPSLDAVLSGSAAPKAAAPKPAEAPALASPYSFPDGRAARTVAEATAILDTLPGEAVAKLLEDPGLRVCLERNGNAPEEIASMVRRYK